MWDFEKQNDATADSTWSELSAMKQKLSKGRRLAAVGSVRQSGRCPLSRPSLRLSRRSWIPRPQQKIRTLYDKYVLIFPSYRGHVER